MTRYDKLLIAGVLLVFVLGAVVQSCTYTAEAQHTPDETEIPRYLYFRGGHTIGTHYSEYPCEIIKPLYEDGVYIGPPDTFPQTDARLIDWQENTVHNIYYREYGTVLYIWRDFTLGEDGHPHPAGAWLVECEFSN